MNKCVNIEVLLKAAEFIEQANIGKYKYFCLRHTK